MISTSATITRSAAAQSPIPLVSMRSLWRVIVIAALFFGC
jgi:hypothetical protein